jgi:hypothetical protein
LFIAGLSNVGRLAQVLVVAPTSTTRSPPSKACAGGCR